MIIITKSKKTKQAEEAKAPERRSLVAMLDKRLAGWEAGRDPSVIHISDLSQDGFCAREFALLEVTKKKPKGQYVSTALRVAFDNGNALSDLCRNKWLKNDVVGSWECLYCNTTVHFSKMPIEDCKKCAAQLWAYREYTIVDEKLGVTGSIDFFIDFENGKYVPIECKSISKDEFKELKGPLAEHRVRTQLYLYHMEKTPGFHTGRVDTSHGKVLYISKGFGAKSEDTGKITPFKEFDVERDDDLAKVLFARGSEFAKFRATKKMPHGVCQNSFDKRGTRCPVLKECWSGSYPAGV